MVNIILFTRFYTSQVVSQISSINSVARWFRSKWAQLYPQTLGGFFSCKLSVEGITFSLTHSLTIPTKEKRSQNLAELPGISPCKKGNPTSPSWSTSRIFFKGQRNGIHPSHPRNEVCSGEFATFLFHIKDHHGLQGCLLGCEQQSLGKKIHK